jgi:hypothetical protein
MILDVGGSKYKNTNTNTNTHTNIVTYAVIAIASIVILVIYTFLLPQSVSREPINGYQPNTDSSVCAQLKHNRQPNIKSVTWAADLVSIKLIPGRKTLIYQEEQITK